MWHRVNQLSRRAQAKAGKQGHSFLGRACILASVGVGSYLGHSYGKKHGERATQLFLEKTLSPFPLPMKGPLTKMISKKFGEQLGAECGMMLGAFLAQAVAKQTLQTAGKYLGKKGSAPPLQPSASALVLERTRTQLVQKTRFGLAKGKELSGKFTQALWDDSLHRMKSVRVSVPRVSPRALALRLKSKVMPQKEVSYEIVCNRS